MQKKLLLAEDSITIRKVFELAFAKSDVAITAVDNGEDAVRLAGEIVPDLVVADVTLPGRDGYAVSAELRAAEKTRGVPVLILSGTLVPLDEDRFRASQANGVLFKPFEFQELLEKVEGLLRKGVEAPVAGKAEEPPPKDEHWDFSDVLDEVEDEARSAKSPDAAMREGVLPGALLPGGAKPAGVSFNEFDVSLDEIEAGHDQKSQPVPPAPPVPERHVEGSLVGDAPPAVTDLTPATEPMEEIEEIEEMEEMEFPEPEPAPDARAAVPPSPVQPLPAGGAILPAEFKEQFSARAEEIFRAVAAEAVEKVMWEMMDRLAADISARVRESVESVAWEVIPATAEALIREEIARIRQQAGTPSP